MSSAPNFPFVSIAIPSSIVSLSSYEHTVKSAQRVLDVFGLVVTPPVGLACLADSLEDTPPQFALIEDLDEILEGKRIAVHKEDYMDGTYLPGVLKSLEWWIGVGETILIGAGMNPGNSTAFPEQKEKMRSLIFETLDAYKAALANSPYFQAPEEDSMAHIELLKCYRRFTRYVCDFAREVWPDVNLDRLFQQP